MKKAFTLAEIMVVLGVIGVLTCILLPTAFQATPDENVMKFKKGHNTFATVIRELINSDQYYKDGDFAYKANGDLIDGTHDGDVTYFCNTMADILNVKKLDCQKTDTSVNGYKTFWGTYSPETIKSQMEVIDELCKKVESKINPDIITVDGIAFYQTNPTTLFGFSNRSGWVQFCGLEANADNLDCANADKKSETILFYHVETEGFLGRSKVFCMDIDGLNQGEDPFAYAVRVDGKIYLGARADEWLEKGIQGDK